MEKNKKNVVEINKKVEGEVWSNALKKSFEKNNKKANIDGFRPGKAPYDIFIKNYGIESLYKDAIDFVLNNVYVETLKESNLIPIVEPSFDITNIDENGVEFIFKITTMPEVNIKKYKDLKVKKDKLEVSDEEVNDEIQKLLEHYAELVIKDGKVENGDTVVIDYVGKVDGVEFDGGKAENYNLVIGSGSFIPGFEDQLIGMEKEETKDINVTFPTDYHAENLKGKEAIFTVTVHEIKTRQNRELNEEFFEDLGMEGINSEESLKESMREEIEVQKKREIENKFVDDLMDAVAKNTEVDIPEELVEKEIDTLIKRAEENMKYQGISLDLYYQFTKTTEEDLRKQLEPEAYKNTLYGLILGEIVKKENISVNDEEIDAELENMSKKYNVKKEEILKEFGDREYLANDIVTRKAVERLSELNEVK